MTIANSVSIAVSSVLLNEWSGWSLNARTGDSCCAIRKSHEG